MSVLFVLVVYVYYICIHIKTIHQLISTNWTYFFYIYIHIKEKEINNIYFGMSLLSPYSNFSKITESSAYIREISFS